MTTMSETVLARYARRNFWLNVLDGSIFTFGVSLVSRFTVLPLIVERLTDAPWAQGLIPAIFFAGWLLPGLFTAPLVAAQPRRKPWVLLATIGERLPFLVLGIILLTLPGLPASMLLVIVLGLYAIFATSAGLTSIAWQDLIARVIPAQRWGVFFGLQAGLGGLLGIGGGALAATILAQQPFPQSVGILSLICFAAMVVSYIFLALTIEPAQAPVPARPFHVFMRGLRPLLRRDVAFRRYLFCRAAIALGLTGHSFLTAAALERFHLPAAEIGLLTGMMLAAQAAGNIGLGALADRWGHKQVLVVSAGMGIAALVLAILAPTSAWFYLIFALVGASQAGYQLSGFTLVFAFSPPAERTTYIGVANLALAPVAALGPIVVGVLATLTGYSAMFVVLALVGLLGMASLHWRVAAPAPVSQTSQAT
ncbi:MFS transporter [Chloroflexus sp.]|uniref:MFS transporter n=1 Tax=Chloroflexus sp. TaxID=1904827 RepID=UPI0026396DA6|nr:MFS transporter [uncultured Chloroflexus sp.]